MAERNVKVKVDLAATGNLGESLKNVRSGVQRLQADVKQAAAAVSVGESPIMKAERQRLLSTGYQYQTQELKRHQQVQAATAAVQGRPEHMGLLAAQSRVGMEDRRQGAVEQSLQARTERQGIGGQKHMDTLKAEIKASAELAQNKRMEARAMNVAQYGVLGANLKEFGEITQKAGMVAAAGMATMTGFVAAASPAAMQTLTGSIQLAAGEIGIMLIPAVVQVAGVVQDVASRLRGLNEATGGMIGKVATVGAVLGTVAIGGSMLVTALKPAISAGMWLYSMSGAAQAATANLAALAGASRAATGAQMVGGGGGRLAGIGGRIGAGLGIAGGAQLAGAMIGGQIGDAASGIGTATGVGYALGGARGGLAGAGVGASQAIGGAIGGTAGSYVGAAGTGASIGALAGPVGAVVGAGVGLLVNAISKGFDSSGDKLAKISMNFQNQTMGVEDLHSMVQRESIKDPMAQAKFEQETLAMEKLVKEVAGLQRAISNVNQSWQVGN